VRTPPGGRNIRWVDGRGLASPESPGLDSLQGRGQRAGAAAWWDYYLSSETGRLIRESLALLEAARARLNALLDGDAGAALADATEADLRLRIEEARSPATASREIIVLFDLRVSPVPRAPAAARLRLLGRIDYDERRVTAVTARMDARLDRLFADFTGALVRKGDHLAEILANDDDAAARAAAEIKARPAAFKEASDTLIRLARDHGIDQLGNLHVVHCPMNRLSTSSSRRASGFTGAAVACWRSATRCRRGCFPTR